MATNKIIASFFDVDETIINGKSMFLILNEIEKIIPSFQKKEILTTISNAKNEGKTREEINLLFYTSLQGIKQKEIQLLAQSYFKKRISEGNFFIAPMVTILEKHKKKGHLIVFISGSSLDFITPIASYLGADIILATQQSIDKNGVYTGGIDNIEPMIGIGKEKAVKNLVAKMNIDLSQSYGFGDHYSDFPFLHLVGHPYILSGDKESEEKAKKLQWQIINNP